MRKQLLCLMSALSLLFLVAWQQAERHLPQLKGSPESEERQPHAVSNYLLQREFPNIMVMGGSRQGNQIALTFDDGPDRSFTPQILDVLKKHHVKATFFLMGSRASALPEITRRIDAEGHEIGNHTYWHPNLAKGSVAAMRWEVTQTENVLQNILGYRPRLFRAPYGILNQDLVRELGRMNYRVVGWNVDSLDWRQLKADEVERNVLGNVHPGAIILMHSAGNWNQDLSGGVQALDRIIPRLQQSGLKFVTISELVQK